MTVAFLILSVLALDGYSDRIANLSVALLAYIAFIPTFRENIPPVSYLTFGDSVVYLNLVGVLVSIL